MMKVSPNHCLFAKVLGCWSEKFTPRIKQDNKTDSEFIIAVTGMQNLESH
jgi:hypothetical protein